MSQLESSCAALHSLLDALPKHRLPDSDSKICSNGIYFMFEAGEAGHNGTRIVRVGSHTGEGNLASRLREHTTPNKDRSIFRKNVGRAILNRERDPFLSVWNFDLTSRKGRECYGAAVDRKKLSVVEEAVTAYMETAFQYCVIPEENPTSALLRERQCIATVSQCGSCKASETWLGLHSPVAKIKTSGLWQVQHLSASPLDKASLKMLVASASRLHSKP